MAKAYKCDLTGKLEAGEGVSTISVQIRPDLKLTVIPHVSADKGTSYQHGVVSPASAEEIKAALQAKFGKPDVAKK